MADTKDKSRKLDEEEDSDEKSPKNKKGLNTTLLIVFGGLLLLIVSIGGTAALFMLRTPAVSDTKAVSPAPKKETKADTTADATEKPAAEATAAEGEGGKPKALFYSIKPVFIVNIQAAGNKQRFLQVQIDVMTHSEKVAAALEENLPLIKNDLVAILSSKKFEDLNAPAGKDTLRQEALKAVKNIMEQQGVDGAVEAVLFPSFVMQ
jgi:flagellar FliL protein